MNKGASPVGDRAVAADAVEPVPVSPLRASIPSAELLDCFLPAILHGDERHRAWLTAAFNALVSEQPIPLPEGNGTMAWRCFHCGDVFTDERCARLHFGRDEGSTPACIIKGAEGGLLKALRDAEEQADDAIQAMHAESTDAARAYHQQRCRHNRALIAAEEAGYERGLADGIELSAQAIEARRATTGTGVVEDESAVAGGHAPKAEGQP